MRSFATVLAAVACNLGAQGISLSGAIADPSGTGISGAQVRLLGSGLSGKSNTQGLYALSNTGIMLPFRSNARFQYQIARNQVHISLDETRHVSAAIYGLDGQRTEQLFAASLSRGNHTLSVPSQGRSGIRILRLRFGTSEFLHPVFFLPSGQVFLSPDEVGPNGEPLAPTLSKTAAAVDTLEVSAAGFLSRKIPVETLTGKLDVVMAKTFAGSRPNVLLLYSDQHQGAALGSEGHPDVLTPNLDKLAQQGVRFTRAYVQNAVCESSRSSLMTGLYPRTLGILDNGDRTQASDKATSMARAFQAAGYQTATFGKRHLVGAIDQSWDIHRDHLWKDRADSYAAWLVSQGKNPANGEPYIRQFAWDWASEFDAGPPGGETSPFGDFGVNYTEPPARDLATHPAMLPETHTMEAWTADNTISFLKNRDKSRPFFCWSSFYRPHQPYNPLKRYQDMYDSAVAGWRSAWGSGLRAGGRIRKPANLSQPADQLPPMLKSWRNNRNKPWNLKTASENEQLYRDYLAAYYALVTEVDKHIGDILRTLDEEGLSENTIVVYTSDHGDFVGRHGMVEKAQVGHATYEETYRVPFMMRWKNRFVPGQKVDGLVEVIDLYPTLMELAGVKKPLDGFTLPGTSLAPALTVGAPVTKPYLVVENWSARTIITRDYKLSKWYSGTALRPGKPDFSAFGDMLFDRSFDPAEGPAFPSETVNHYSNPAFATQVKELEKKMADWMGTVSDAGRKELMP